MRLLVIEDSELDYEMLLVTLASQGVAVTAERVESAAQLREALQRGWDLVISDHRLPGFTSHQALRIVRELPSPPPFIIVSGVIGEDMAVRAMQRGADDYLIKGRLARLGTAVRNAVEASRARRERAETQARLAQSQEQLRNLSHRLQAAIDEERSAIAREIHDDIGGTLTAVRFDLESLGRHVDAAALPRLQRAQQSLAQAHETTQRLMHNLRPPILDAGLPAAIESLVRQFRERTGVATEFEHNAPRGELEAPIALALYRACQEALTNIAKHAQARSVAIGLHHGQAAVSLEVTDDGRGLDPAALRKPESLGLRGLAERAFAVGGALDISSHEGRTTLMVWLPTHRRALRVPRPQEAA
ncbi:MULTISPECIES: response regulator [Ramlibacter]|uniref:histidine kinase n=1 Tax=Ramlibacter aquaticus TaxID=2780094 RepID=A0ABR9SAB0_9BURK|nr:MULTISPECIES: response regulator [Ramlibacter]MBE7939285.1 response regulator [Ramlibacter aquaticus]